MSASRAALRLETPSATAGVEHLLTVREVAEILGLHPKRVYELGIPSVRLSARRIRFRPADVERYITEHRDGAP